MVEGAIFIGAVIIGITQFIKLVRDKNYGGALTIVAAVVVGVLVALTDTHIGVVDITVAQGVMIALGASGTVTVAEKVG